MNITHVAEYLQLLNERSRKEIKAEVEQLLLAGHIIQKNAGKLKSTVIAKIAHELDIDVKIAAVVAHAFVTTEQAEMIGDKLHPIGREPLNPNPLRWPYTAPQEDLEIRRGVAQVADVTAHTELSSVPKRIDTDILRKLDEDYPDLEAVDDYQVRTAISSAKQAPEVFYEHVYGCSRGRFYPDQTTCFGTQSQDSGKALIREPAERVSPGSEKCIVKEANDFFDGDIEVTEDNILDLDYKEADKPYQFLRCQYSWMDYLAGRPVAQSVSFDARCQGSQILSGIGRYPELMPHIGMVVEEHELDLYERVAHEFHQILAEERPDLLLRNPMLIERSTVKRPCMTKIYNAKLTSIMEELRKAGVDASDVVDSSKLLHSALNNTFGGCQDIMDWLIQCSRIISKAGNKTIQWELPDGFIGSQTYVKQKSLRVSKKIQMTSPEIRNAVIRGRKMPSGGWVHNLRVSLLVPDLGINGQETPDSVKHANAICADITHASDACIMRKVVGILAEKNIQVTRMVHDSISVHVNYADELYQAVIDASVWFFKRDFLIELYAQWTELYDLELPAPPKQGSWCPETLRECNRYWT